MSAESARPERACRAVSSNLASTVVLIRVRAMPRSCHKCGTYAQGPRSPPQAATSTERQLFLERLQHVVGPGFAQGGRVVMSGRARDRGAAHGMRRVDV